MTATARNFPHACPRCNGPILWCDGQPAPELTIVLEGGAQRIVGCGRCLGRRRAPAQPPPKPQAPPKDPRPVRQILAEEGARVVGLLDEGLKVAESVRGFWNKLKGKS